MLILDQLSFHTRMYEVENEDFSSLKYNCSGKKQTKHNQLQKKLVQYNKWN